MNKSSFRLAFMAVLVGSLSGCASPMRMFSKKPHPFDEYVAQHKAEQTRIASSQALPGDPAEVSELLHQGHTAFQQGNLPEAQSKYSAVVQRQPNHPVANHRLGVIADRQQDYMTAQRYYFAALNASPNDPNLLNDIGYSFLLQSRFPEAENYLQGALQKNPKQSNAINNLGLLYAKQGQAERALVMFRMTNSEAEAQAKVARLMPSGLNAAPQSGSLMAQPYNAAPANPAVAANGGLAFGYPQGNAPGGITQPQVPSNIASNSWTPPDLAPPNNSSPIAQTGAINDPNVPEATRRLKEQMESIRLNAIADRQSRDSLERQHQEMLKRQLRDEELGRANIVNPVYSQPNGANRWNGAPTSASPNPNAPIVIGPPPNVNVPNPAQWQAMPDGQRPITGEFEPMPNGQSNAMPNLVPNSRSDTMPNTLSNSRPEPMPNTLRGSLPPASTGSPLDTMPTWPPAGSLPAITPNNPAVGSQPTLSAPNNGAWPNGFPPGVADDPARAASRMGMNAGSGNPFQITPGPNSGATNAPNRPNSPNSFNNFAPTNGVSPTTMPNWPANSNPPNYGQPTGEPPAGTFGSSQIRTPVNSQDQLPPSEQYQMPGRFGYLPAGATQTQPTSFGANRGAGGTPTQQFGSQSFPTPAPNQPLNSLERANTRARISDRFDGDERWENGAAPGTQSVQTSTPTMQGHLAAPYGDTSLLEYERMIHPYGDISLLEYERMIQQLNSETNQIRQQIDDQRQLPASENFLRSRTQPQTGTPNGSMPRQ